MDWIVLKLKHRWRYFFYIELFCSFTFIHFAVRQSPTQEVIENSTFRQYNLFVIIKFNIFTSIFNTRKRVKLNLENQTIIKSESNVTIGENRMLCLESLHSIRLFLIRNIYLHWIFRAPANCQIKPLLHKLSKQYSSTVIFSSLFLLSPSICRFSLPAARFVFHLHFTLGCVRVIFPNQLLSMKTSAPLGMPAFPFEKPVSEIFSVPFSHTW